MDELVRILVFQGLVEKFIIYLLCLISDLLIIPCLIHCLSPVENTQIIATKQLNGKAEHVMIMRRTKMPEEHIDLDKKNENLDQKWNERGQIVKEKEERL